MYFICYNTGWLQYKRFITVILHFYLSNFI